MRHPWLTVRMAVMGTILFAFYAALVAVFAPAFGLPVVVGATLVFVVVQYKLSKYLAVRGVGATDVPEPGEDGEYAEYAWLHDVVDDLSDEMGIDSPRIMIGQMGVPNAFAVGRKGAGTVVVSDTLLTLLERDEVEGVLAHELAHIKNRDVLMMLLGQSVATLIGMSVFWILALAEDSIVGVLLGWVVSIVVQAIVMIFVLAISRYREYVADSDAARYTDDPEALGRALAKIESVGQHEQAPDVSDTVGALCIFGGKRGLLSMLFASHPPMEKRIAKLAPHLLQEENLDAIMSDMVAGLE